MRKQIGALAAIVLLAGFASSGWAQRGVIDRTGAGAYEDISKRQTRSTEREDRKKKEAEEAKKKAEEEKRRDERRKRYEAETGRRETPSKGMTTTTGSKDAANGKKGPGAKGGAKGAATQPATAGGNADPTTQEVNQVILNSVRTQRVDFNPEAAKQNPKMIILNEPKFDPKDRVRAGDTGMAQPL